MQHRRRYWTAEEDEILLNYIKLTNCNWRMIAEQLNDRNPSQCAQRWKRIKPLNEQTRNKWTADEDQQVIDYVEKYGHNWGRVSDEMRTRTGRQIRERYINHLDPSITHKKWSKAEDKLVWKLYKDMGTRWSDISKLLPGRPENSVKNRFYSSIRAAYGNISNPYYVVPTGKLTQSDLNNHDSQESEIWCQQSCSQQFSQIAELSHCPNLQNNSLSYVSNLKDDKTLRSFYSQLGNISHISVEDQDRYEQDISDNQPFNRRRSQLKY